MTAANGMGGMDGTGTGATTSLSVPLLSGVSATRGPSVLLDQHPVEAEVWSHRRIVLALKMGSQVKRRSGPDEVLVGNRHHRSYEYFELMVQS